MPDIKTEVTWGNVASILATLISVGTLVWYMSSALTELKSKGINFDATLQRLVIERDARRKIIDERIDLLMRDRDRTARIEVTLDLMAKTLARLEAKLDRVEAPRN